MTTAEALDRGREAFERHAWTDAYAQLSAADRDNALESEDLERLAVAAYLVGHDADSAASVGAGTSAVPEAGRRAASCAMCILAGVRTLQQGRT